MFIRKHIGDEPFLLTYGDGVGNIDILKLLDTHKKGGKVCTVTSVQPSGRFGALNISNDGSVSSFTEKPKGDGSWINGGFFVCEPGVFKYIENDSTVWEREPMENLAAEGQMFSYKHQGFWKPMDTLRDKIELDEDWRLGKAKWKTW